MNERNLLFMTAPTREDFTIPFHDIGEPGRRPKVAFVAGLRGDELNGVFVLSRLADFLTAVATGKHAHQSLQERVIIIPAVNVLGLNTRSRQWPFDKMDINRMFPGYETGETTQRIAHAVLNATRDAYYRIDVHSANEYFEEMPQVRLYEPHDDERASACLFGLPAVIERPVNKLFTATLAYAWRAFDGENFVIQVGQAGNLQRQHCERLFHALVAFLLHSGILQGAEISEEDEDLHYFGLKQALPLVSSSAGMFVSTLEVGSWLKAGDTIGYVYDSFNGRVLEEVRAPRAGLLTGIRRQPLLFEGDLLARISTLKPLLHGHDIHLHDLGQ
jgi:Predicted deacylase